MPPTERYNSLQQSFEKELFASEPETVEEALPLNALCVPTEYELEDYALPVFHVELVRVGELILSERPQIQSPSDVAQVFSQYLQGTDREHFVLLMLDSKNRVIGVHTVSIGILDSALVHPREIFKPLFLSNAASFIIAHNHPSGDPEPSLEDKRVTERILEAGRLLGVELLDHIVIGQQGTFRSLKSMGVI